MSKLIKVIITILGLVIVLLVAAAAYLYFWLYSQQTVVPNESQEVEVTDPETEFQGFQKLPPSEYQKMRAVDTDAAAESSESDGSSQNTEASYINSDEYSEGDHPYLSDSQEQTLKSIGIDPAALPTELTPAQEQCFVDKFGLERVMEIINGATPSPLELLRAKGCLE